MLVKVITNFPTISKISRSKQTDTKHLNIVFCYKNYKYLYIQMVISYYYDFTNNHFIINCIDK